MNVLEITDLRKHYFIHAGLLRREVGSVKAVDGITFHIARGETLALVGESGCGKTTVSRCIVRAVAPSSGKILFRMENGAAVDLAPLSERALHPVRKHLQMIFQDPYSSLNPRMLTGDIIAEPLRCYGVDRTKRAERVKELLDLVGLPPSAATRYPHAFSGGQRQRIGIARALALNPKLLVADEAVSALDVSVQAQIVNLLLDLQDRLGLSMLFVAHDLSVVRHVSDRTAVMYAGRIVEVGRTDAIYTSPRHPYTAALLSSVPKLDPKRRAEAKPALKETIDPGRPTLGCSFCPRCPYAIAQCREEIPALRPLGKGIESACHRAEELQLAGVGPPNINGGVKQLNA
jgi:oligopeptide/dipeptide ABC transporter ATP-binding protein